MHILSVEVLTESFSSSLFHTLLETLPFKDDDKVVISTLSEEPAPPVPPRPVGSDHNSTPPPTLPPPPTQDVVEEMESLPTGLHSPVTQPPPFLPSASASVSFDSE